MPGRRKTPLPLPPCLSLPAIPGLSIIFFIIIAHFMTHDQHIASDPAISAWVSASAGTGKTKVLTDRVLRLLLSGADPSRILCITYTRAASAEMESRLSEELARWVTATDESLKTSLKALTG